MAKGSNKRRQDDGVQPQLSRVKAQRNALVPDVALRLSFKAWFVNLLDQDSRVKAHHYEQLRLFMAGLGISENETASRYESGLRSYFGN